MAQDRPGFRSHTSHTHVLGNMEGIGIKKPTNPCQEESFPLQTLTLNCFSRSNRSKGSREQYLPCLQPSQNNQHNHSAVATEGNLLLQIMNGSATTYESDKGRDNWKANLGDWKKHTHVRTMTRRRRRQREGGGGEGGRAGQQHWQERQHDRQHERQQRQRR